MAPCLYDSFRVARPHISSILVPPEAIARIERLCRLLAPIHCGGFECRLNEVETVDFQQRILVKGDEPFVLAKHIGSSELEGDAAWQRLGRFCRDLTEPSSWLHHALSTIWLEFDMNEENATPAPSVFITLDEREVESITNESLADLIDFTATRLTGQATPKSTQSSLVASLDAMPAGVFVHHVGLMLSRRAEVLRLVIRGFSPSALEAYMEHIRWRGDGDRFHEFLDRLPHFMDQLVLSLDVGDRIFPTLGLEYFPGTHPDLEPRWSALFDFLVTEGWCQADKADALLGWPGHTTPAESDVPWPSHLLFDSLLAPSDLLSVLGRRLSHVKVVHAPTEPTLTKAYWGFGPLLLQTKAQDESSHGLSRSRVLSTNGSPVHSRTLEAAINAGISYLLDIRDDEGWWRDFVIQAGSDEWVTAYVGAQLARLSSETAERAANQAWDLLEKRIHPSGGWGFNVLSPKDADTTSWGLRLAQALGKGTSERAALARGFLQHHILPDGGITTFVETSRLRFLSRVPAESSVEGWCSAATDVTAAASGVEGFEGETTRFLRDAQLEEGYWEGYWIGDEEYTTALAVETLASEGRRVDHQRVDRAVQWLVRRRGPGFSAHSETHGGESPFAAALSLRILLLGAANAIETHRLIKEAVHWLLGCQRADGSWPPSFRFRHPPAGTTHGDRDQYACINLDDKSTFTTSTVLAALNAILLQAHVRPGLGEREE